MRTSDFDYELPEQLIAQSPADQRDQSRLLVIERTTGAMVHGQFRDLKQWLRPGDLLILNDSRVIPARLRAVKSGTGGQIEVLLVEEQQTNDWWAMVRPGKRLRPNSRIQLLDRSGAPSDIFGVVREKNAEGHGRIQFELADNILDRLGELGEVPLPPYIHRPAQSGGVNDLERYQTVFAREEGSVAAPTAGLHFTAPILAELKQRGVEIRCVTLHVGLGTFAPVKSEIVEEHRMHEERYSIPAEAAAALNQARGEGRRVVAVGTTTMRVLESAVPPVTEPWQAMTGRTRIFIYPPFHFKAVTALLTNFHLPRSTLLMLVSAFASPGDTRGRELILAAYREAVRQRYRFFSYGDAMFIG